ncbi:hypothetical protein NEDG_00474 [Nematocida displodere]|uniref:Uncharacterized protein n=1 Tax=Nematocida displodere TaxID=1805483 RepID=A0A177ELY9_9MICR|nr:hypothetical protein NEDG_00474 [Nematocida displodere]
MKYFMEECPGNVGDCGNCGDVGDCGNCGERADRRLGVKDGLDHLIARGAPGMYRIGILTALSQIPNKPTRAEQHQYSQLVAATHPRIYQALLQRKSALDW